jgi:16S rRNA processing protein RimM
MVESALSERPELPAVGGTAWVDVGRVARPHGLDGTVLVNLHGDDPGNLLRAERARLSGTLGQGEFAIRSARSAGGRRDGGARVRVRFDGIDGRDAAQRWAGATVELRESALQPLPAGEYYWRELIGTECRTLDGRSLGRVEEIWPTPGNDMLVVRSGAGRLLVPALRQLLVRLDPAAGVLWIDPPAGLLEEP